MDNYSSDSSKRKKSLIPVSVTQTAYNTLEEQRSDMVKPVRVLLVRILIEKAIVIEEHAYRYYSFILGKTYMKDTFDLMKRLSSQELQHRMKLEDLQRKIGIEKHDLPAMKKQEIAGVISEDLESLCDARPVPASEDSVEAMLRDALHRERRTCMFYQTLLQRTSRSDVVNLFKAIYHEEKEHAGELEEELERLST
jgi:rubrerythrin